MHQCQPFALVLVFTYGHSFSLGAHLRPLGSLFPYLSLGLARQCFLDYHGIYSAEGHREDVWQNVLCLTSVWCLSDDYTRLMGLRGKS